MQSLRACMKRGFAALMTGVAQFATRTPQRVTRNPFFLVPCTLNRVPCAAGAQPTPHTGSAGCPSFQFQVSSFKSRLRPAVKRFNPGPVGAAVLQQRHFVHKFDVLRLLVTRDTFSNEFDQIGRS